jgi:hypothetical protein
MLLVLNFILQISPGAKQIVSATVATLKIHQIMMQVLCPLSHLFLMQMLILKKKVY